MPAPEPLPIDRLARRCDPASLPFETTADLEPLGEPIGQDDARRAVEFGVDIPHDGYHLFVMGPPGIGKRTMVDRLVRARAAGEAAPSDWCYVNNFEHPGQPCAIEFPTGGAVRFKREMAAFIDEIAAAIPAALESEEHQSGLREIDEALKERQEQAMQQIAADARAENIALLRTPAGFAFAPMQDGKVLEPDAFAALPEEEQRKVQQAIGALNERMQDAMRQFVVWMREGREKARQLTREGTLAVVGDLVADVKTRWAEHATVCAYLDAVQAHVVDHVGDFRPQEEEGLPGPMAQALAQMGDPKAVYAVNVVVDNAREGGAPVVCEEHPTYHNLVGRIEHRARFGALSTDFTLIKPGALHRASGGYLVLDARKVLQQPFAWEALKGALRTRQVRLESLDQYLSLVSTTSLEPEPIPLSVKVVLLGDRWLYYMLQTADPEFSDLFRTSVDLEDDVDRDGATDLACARLVAGIVQAAGLRPVERDAVAAIVERLSRVANDATKLSLHMGELADLVRQADYWAGKLGRARVDLDAVERAIDEAVRRVDRVRRRLQQQIARGTILIDVDGERVGQVNGLSVLSLGRFAFGQPSRITATARLGAGEVVDIEREAKLGGPTHSKGVLILASFLADRFARDRPLSLAASLVFEQSYGMIDGDSASVGEACALLSALAEVPVRQGVAITGSLNQRGDVQAIGGVNEKIEGFFDACRARGLTGTQGVVIPEANVEYLMLRRDLLAAAERGEFRIWSVRHVDEAVELLTGVPAGTRDAAGRFPPDSVNGRADARLAALLAARQRYGAAAHAAEARSDDER